MKLGKGLVNHKGRNKGGAFGHGGYCLCVKCGHKVPHQQVVKCTEIKYPKCGHTMVREELMWKSLPKHKTEKIFQPTGKMWKLNYNSKNTRTAGTIFSDIQHKMTRLNR